MKKNYILTILAIATSLSIISGCGTSARPADNSKDTSITTSITAEPQTSESTDTSSAVQTPVPTATEEPKPTQDIPADSTASEEPDLSETDSFEYEDNWTDEEKDAVRQARAYLDISGFSREGLIEMLLLEGYTEDDAVFGADNTGADWYEEATRKAESYLDISSYSFDGMVSQLQRIDKFTELEAIYGADHCSADWSGQAVEKASFYLANGDYTREELIEQLIYDGFTDDEAEAAANAVGF